MTATLLETTNVLLQRGEESSAGEGLLGNDSKIASAKDECAREPTSSGACTVHAKSLCARKSCEKSKIAEALNLIRAESSKKSGKISENKALCEGASRRRSPL